MNHPKTQRVADTHSHEKKTITNCVVSVLMLLIKRLSRRINPLSFFIISLSDFLIRHQFVASSEAHSVSVMGSVSKDLHVYENQILCIFVSINHNFCFHSPQSMDQLSLSYELLVKISYLSSCLCTQLKCGVRMTLICQYFIQKDE